MERLKYFIMIFLPIFAACHNSPTKIETQEVDKPIMYVPMPPKVDRPELESSKLTAAQRKKIGEISKATGNDAVNLLNYSIILETIIDKYKELSKLNPKFNEEMMKKLTSEQKDLISKIQEYFDSITKKNDKDK